jgi:tRNA threonylcarbamoyladenosine biosynthesis protein TsaB
MSALAQPRLLILETSGRIGQVALAEGAVLRGSQRLDETRRHARDLAPAVQSLLADEGWRPRDLHGVLVGRGPGSYTGLRVGIISAKALAYATGCVLLGIDTFHAIAQQAPPEAMTVDVVADAQQDKLYIQQFSRAGADTGMTPRSQLHIRPFAEWATQITQLADTGWVSGPGLRGHESHLPPGCRVAPMGCWDPRPESLLDLGLARFLQGERDDLWALEPLYLRASAAEQQWQARTR